MTGENRKRNVADELERADEALAAARALAGLSLYNDAVSRAYYGAFHFLRAALLSRGVEPKTHSGALHLFNVELVRAGLLSGTFNRLLGGLQRARELADYDAAVRFGAEDAKAELSEAEAFGSAVREMLQREGWIAAPKTKP